ncbi:CCN family member 2 isoform X2 [Microcaecilia unicolor]|uniref:CCN family member 3 n=1 Tax=Microcaecilia unicolor TaxID=1415580 RepID=A0A6P7ZB62_9AMPH|nr:CCN family member 2-like isoform X2 [Microcaecilia unicolor]
MDRSFITLSLLFLLPCWAEVEECSYPCQCPMQPLICPAGTSLILDSCGCCKVCAKQLGDPCSRTAPCDPHRGLYCDFSNVNFARGVCLAQEGSTCDLGGTVYRSGESFQPSCKYQCTCMDGAIGCVPLCAHDLRLPSPDCPAPRRVKIPGQCCEEWVCGHSERENLFESGQAVYRQVPAYSPELNNLQENCLVQTTEWSTCSKSCGMGISTRITNDNHRCHLEKETRLCMVRPCDLPLEKIIKKGKKCLRAPRSEKSLHFEFSGCTSARTFRPRFCGSCTDGRCCTPNTSTTLDVKFKCPEGEVFSRKMMFIRSCLCHHDCPRDNDIFLALHHRKMNNDYIRMPPS